jgi:hypothetical protein
MEKYILGNNVCDDNLINEENEFFNEVYTSMKEFADIAVPFWSGAQMSNAKLGMAHAATLK